MTRVYCTYHRGADADVQMLHPMRGLMVMMHVMVDVVVVTLPVPKNTQIRAIYLPRLQVESTLYGLDGDFNFSKIRNRTGQDLEHAKKGTDNFFKNRA